MFTHEEIWVALDRLAEAHNYSTSGLAKKAGLDPTTFNKSKRITPDGKPRWPSTESIAKSLAATEATLLDLIGFIENTTLTPTSAGLSTFEHYDLSQNELKRLNQKNLPTIIDAPENSFAITLTTPQWTPTYKKGTTLIACPTDNFEPDDIIFIETHDSQFFIMAVDSIEEEVIALRAIVINEPDRRLERADILKSAKVLWASQ
ncbi:MAG: helix-turn-helix transcriptional regulator [Alphaproteobacteria bacterium]|nr:helix-turn-helix transcriptional regulator [Alphaproteobacteria bacterium]